MFAIGHGEAFGERHIDRLEMRRDHRISSNISEGALRRNDERGRVEPSESLACRCGRREVSVTDARAVRHRVVGAGIIETTVECHWHAALDCRVRAQLPAPDECVRNCVIDT